MRKLLAILLLIATPACSGPEETCRALIAAMPRFIGEAPLISSLLKTPYSALFDECDSADTFAGHPLGGHTDSHGIFHPYRCSTDRNRVAHLGSFTDHTVAFTAKAAVDLDGSKLGCGAGFPNQCGTALIFDHPGSVHPRVNAEDTSFAVIPRDFVTTDPVTNRKTVVTSFSADTGIGQGDLAVMVYRQRCTFGVVGDAGPHFRLGEISMRGQKDLSNPQCVKADEYPCTAVVRNNEGRGLDADVSYFIFPASRPVPLHSQNVDAVALSQGIARVERFIADFVR